MHTPPPHRAAAITASLDSPLDVVGRRGVNHVGRAGLVAVVRRAAKPPAALAAAVVLPASDAAALDGADAAVVLVDVEPHLPMLLI